MPFLVALIPVITGAVVATEIAGLLLIGSAVVGAVGYVTGNEDLAKVSGILGLAGGIAAIGSYFTAPAAEVAAGGATSTAAAGEVAVTGEVAGEVAGVSGANIGEVSGIADDFATAGTFGGDEALAAGQAAGSGTAEAISGSPQANALTGAPEPQLPLEMPKPAIPGTDISLPSADTIPSATTGLDGSPVESGADFGSGAGTDQSGFQIKTEDDGILSNALKGVKNIKDATGERGFASLLEITGKGLAGAFGENPNMEQVKLNRLKYQAELEAYRRRMANINNIGLLQLGFRARPEVTGG